MVVMLFFFSSRRRHTRYWRDWSSDVCSSDLAMVGCAEPTVVTWRRRYAESGLAGLEDLPRPGKPSPLPEALRDRVLELTLTEPPTQYGVTHWSSRLLAAALAAEGTPISHVTVARIWHRFGRAALARTDLQVLHRSAAGGQGPRRRRAASASAGAGG